MRALPARLLAVLQQLPADITLKIEREGHPGSTCQFFPGRDPGCWLAVAPMRRWGGAWGRSCKSAEEAVRKMLEAGGRPLTRRTGAPALRLLWQPRCAWERHAEQYPQVAADVGEPYVDADGSTNWWGSPRLTQLWPTAGGPA